MLLVELRVYHVRIIGHPAELEDSSDILVSLEHVTGRAQSSNTMYITYTSQIILLKTPQIF